MGTPNLGNEATVFFNHARHLHRQWTAFEQLFVDYKLTARSERPDNILLMGHARELFDAVKLALINDVIMTIARLTDPKQTRNKRNLSIEHMVEYSRNLMMNRAGGPLEVVQAKRLQRLQVHHIRVKKLTPKIRDFRNKLLAHLDLDTATGKAPLSLSRLRTVRRAVEEIYHIAAECRFLETDSFLDIRNEGIKSAVKWCLKCVAYGSENPSQVLRSLKAPVQFSATTEPAPSPTPQPPTSTA
ncbi:MAG: hypothetical protein ACP5I8_06125 [Phycisphaerae bacterium]